MPTPSRRAKHMVVNSNLLKYHYACSTACLRLMSLLHITDSEIAKQISFFIDTIKSSDRRLQHQYLSVSGYNCIYDL